MPEAGIATNIDRNIPKVIMNAANRVQKPIIIITANTDSQIVNTAKVTVGLPNSSEGYESMIRSYVWSFPTLCSRIMQPINIRM